MTFPMQQPRRYPAELTAPMREELTNAGFRELTTEADVESAIGETTGSTLLVVNSVCGCAASIMRPGVIKALERGPRPDHLVTVMAGQDLEAVAKARGYLTGMPPSSPSVALLRDGKLQYMMHRHEIEGRLPEQITSALAAALNEHGA